jgi:hypothetical protein
LELTGQLLRRGRRDGDVEGGRDALHSIADELHRLLGVTQLAVIAGALLAT